MSTKTFRREVLQSVVVGRGPERHYLSTGQVFDFTEEELKQLPAGAVSTKTTVDLDSGDVNLKEVETQGSANQTNAPSAEGSTKPAKAGKKAQAEDL